MKKLLTVCCLAVSSVAFAQSAPPPAAGAPAAAAMPPAAGAAMDWSKMGAPSRKPTDEKKTKKEIEAFMKTCEANEAKQDWDAELTMIDFPVYMATDDAKGTTEGRPVTKEQYVEMMKGMGEMPKDMKTTHKPTVTVLTDSLAMMVDDFTMTMGKNKLSGRNASLMVKVDGAWKRKMMVEGGWGGMTPPPAKTTASAAPAAGTPAAKSPASATAAPPSKGGATAAPPPPSSAPAAAGATSAPPPKK